jgi:hypothetical protein
MQPYRSGGHGSRRKSARCVPTSRHHMSGSTDRCLFRDGPDFKTARTRTGLAKPEALRINHMNQEASTHGRHQLARQPVRR